MTKWLLFRKLGDEVDMNYQFTLWCLLVYNHSTHTCLIKELISIYETYMRFSQKYLNFQHNCYVLKTKLHVYDMKREMS